MVCMNEDPAEHMAYYEICIKLHPKGPFTFGPQGHQGPKFYSLWKVVKR